MTDFENTIKQLVAIQSQAAKRGLRVKFKLTPVQKANPPRTAPSHEQCRAADLRFQHIHRPDGHLCGTLIFASVDSTTVAVAIAVVSPKDKSPTRKAGRDWAYTALTDGRLVVVSKDDVARLARTGSLATFVAAATGVRHTQELE